MCAEGIAIGRQLIPEFESAGNISVGVTTQVAKADASRVGISFSITGDEFMSAAVILLIGVRYGGSIPTIVTLSSGSPHVYLSVERYGPQIMEEMHAFLTVDVTCELTVWGFRLPVPIADAARY